MVSAFNWKFWLFTKWLTTVINQFWLTRNGLRKFRTIVSEVSSFVGNPVYFDIFVVFVLYFCSGFTALVKEMYFIWYLHRISYWIYYSSSGLIMEYIYGYLFYFLQLMRFRYKSIYTTRWKFSRRHAINSLYKSVVSL